MHEDHNDADVVRVSEMWASRERRDAAVGLPAVRDNAAAIMDLIEGPPLIADSLSLRGARIIHGETGAVVCSILAAPDLAQYGGLLDRYELDQVAEARYLREQLGAVQSAFTQERLGPASGQGWAHRRAGGGEPCVALAGSGHGKGDGGRLDLRRLDAIRIAPGSAHELRARSDGLKLLGFGVDVCGDESVVAERPGL